MSGGVDPLLVAVAAGLTFAAMDLGVLWPAEDEWPTRTARLRALAGTASVRFATGFLIVVIDVGVPRWVSGLLLAAVLSLALTRFDPAPRRVMALGLAGALFVGVAADVVLSRWAPAAG
jgi:hypothetical protein